jgi:hypothetical protein
MVAIPLSIGGAVFDSLADIAGVGGVLALISQVIGEAIWSAVYAVLICGWPRKASIPRRSRRCSSRRGDQTAVHGAANRRARCWNYLNSR